MKIRTIVFGLSIVLLLGVNVSTAQSPSRAPNATLHPCPGGTGVAEVDGFHPTSLDQLVRASDLIMVGTVLNVLPAFSNNPEHLISIETHSLVALEEVLYGTLPPGNRRIVLAQQGGQAGPCKLVVPDDPLVQDGEEYVFFLLADEPDRVPETAPGLRRYVGAGVWGGRAKVVDGKIQFPPSAGPGLEEYNGIDAAAFIATVANRITVWK